MIIRSLIFCSFAVAILNPCSPALAQNQRDEKVRKDRLNLLAEQSWYYDDFESGLRAAKESDKPLMVVLRCIP